MQSARQRSERILIADDDAGVVGVISDHLRHAGYQVLTAADGAGALALARDAQPDLALIGLVLPDGSGLETCRALAGSTAAPAVFILATIVDRETRLAALAAGADEVIAKPFDPVDLVGRIGAYLGASTRGEPRHPLTNLPFRSTLDAASMALRTVSKARRTASGASRSPGSGTYQARWRSEQYPPCLTPKSR